MDFATIFRFIRLLSVEPLGFLTLFLYLFKKSAVDQMIQDKICIQRYQLDEMYCNLLPTLSDEEDTLRMKSTILGDVTTFNMYVNLGLALPTFTIGILIGPFIDKWAPAKRYLLIYTSVIFLLESISYLVNSYFFTLNYLYIIIGQGVMALSAGQLIGMTCVWSYLSAVTPNHLRSIRMIIMEVFISTASPVAIALGGNLLDLPPLFPGAEPRNYCCIFFISCACSVAYLLIAIFAVNHTRDRKLFKEIQLIDKNLETKHTTEFPKPKIEETEEHKSIFEIMQMLFDFENAKQQIMTVIVKRPHGIRLQVIFLFLAKMIDKLSSFGPSVFIYQYVQRVFSWKAAQYSNYLTVSHAVNILTTFLGAPLIIRVFKLSDLSCSLIGTSMILLQNVARCLGTSLWAFYLALPFYTLNAISSVGIQAYITKVTDRREIGRIFSLMSVMDAFTPLVGSVIFSNIFRLLIDSKPNLCFLFVACGMALGIGLTVAVAFKSKRTLQLIEIDKEAKLENVEQNVDEKL